MCWLLSVLAIHLGPTPGQAQATGRHPDLRYTAQLPGPHNSANLTAPARPLPFRLGSRTLATFGSESDPDSLILGDIRGAVLLPRTRVVLLDDKLFHLRLFDPAGRPLQVLSRQGQGPGELSRGAYALTVDPLGALYVADVSRSVKIFEATPAGTYRYARAIALPFSPRSLCLLGPVLVAAGPRITLPEVVHTYDLTGRPGPEFGTLYSSPNDVVNLSLNDGIVACDPARHLIYLAGSPGIGDIRAYSPDGKLVWRTTLTGWRSALTEDIDRGYTVRFNPEGEHTLIAMTLLQRYGLLVQVGFRTLDEMKQGDWYGTLTTFLLDPATGIPVSLGQELPPILAGNDSTVVIVQKDPAPCFAVRHIGAP